MAHRIWRGSALLAAALLIVFVSPRGWGARADGQQSAKTAEQASAPAAGVSQTPPGGQTSPARPTQKPVESVKPLEPLAVTQLDERPHANELDGRIFSVQFAESLPIRDILLFLVRDTPLSVVADPDVQGSFVGELKNVSLRQALDLLLHPMELDYSVQGRFIRVFRRKVETRIFDINYVVTQRTANRVLGAATSATDPGGAVSGGTVGTGADRTVPPSAGASATQVKSVDEGDLFRELATGVQTLLSPEGRFNLDRKAGLLQISDFPDRLAKVSLYVEAVETRMHRQVQIQARVVEIELRDEFAAGVDWTGVFRDAANAVTVTQALAPAAGAGIVVNARVRDFQGLLKVLATHGRVNVLSSPRVVAMNNEPAVMRIGTQDVYFLTTSQVDATTGRVLQTTVTPQPITEGIVLSLTPQVSSDGVVNLTISPSVTERVGEARSRLGDTVPVLSVRETDTLVRVLQGETIVIAGLMQERVRSRTMKVPLLGDLPLVGGLFRREERVRSKTDLAILLTPTVLTPTQIADTAARESDRLGVSLDEPSRK